VFYEPRRAARVVLLSSAAARRAEGYEDALANSRTVSTAPLIGVLRQGNRDGSLRSLRPEHDADTLLAVVGRVCDPYSVPRFADRDDARRHVQRFCWPGLGLAVPPEEPAPEQPRRGAATQGQADSPRGSGKV
jgi:hypothetical protein